MFFIFWCPVTRVLLDSGRFPVRVFFSKRYGVTLFTYPFLLPYTLVKYAVNIMFSKLPHGRPNYTDL